MRRDIRTRDIRETGLRDENYIIILIKKIIIINVVEHESSSVSLRKSKSKEQIPNRKGGKQISIREIGATK